MLWREEGKKKTTKKTKQKQREVGCEVSFHKAAKKQDCDVFGFSIVDLLKFVLRSDNHDLKSFIK